MPDSCDYKTSEPLVEAAVLKFKRENRQLRNEASFVPVERWYAFAGAVKDRDERPTGALDSPPRTRMDSCVLDETDDFIDTICFVLQKGKSRTLLSLHRRRGSGPRFPAPLAGTWLLGCRAPRLPSLECSLSQVHLPGSDHAESVLKLTSGAIVWC
jgi:hypothetical protein